MVYFYTVSVCFILCHSWVGVLEEVKFCTCVLELVWFILVTCFLEYPLEYQWSIVQLLAFTKLFRFGATSCLPLQYSLMLTAYGCVQTFVEIPKYPINWRIWSSTKWIMSKNLNRKVKQRGCQKCFTIKSTINEFSWGRRDLRIQVTWWRYLVHSAGKLHKGKHRERLLFGQNFGYLGWWGQLGAAGTYFESGLPAVQHLLRLHSRSFILKRFLEFIPG